MALNSVRIESGAEAVRAVSPETVPQIGNHICNILSANKVFGHCTFTCGSFILSCLLPVCSVTFDLVFNF